jgi:hypothetical protein
VVRRTVPERRTQREVGAEGGYLNKEAAALPVPAVPRKRADDRGTRFGARAVCFPGIPSAFSN